MDLHAHTLFVHDARGRISAWNQPGAPRAPRFFLGRTREGHLWRLRADLPTELVRELARLAAAERGGLEPASQADPERMAALLACLAAHAPVGEIWRGPAFRFPEELPAPDPEEAVLLGPADAERLHAFPGLAPELARRLPAAAVEEQGRIAAVCHCATGPGPAVEAGVETLPELRRRGLATRAVRAWAHAVGAAGRIPLFSTAWRNRPARALARRLGLVAYGSDLHVA
jgi:GNAT superfamily N-acetyltransferase